MKKLLTTLAIAWTIALTVNISANFSYYTSGGDWHFSLLFALGITTLGVVCAYFIFPLFRKFKWTQRSTLKLAISVLLYTLYGLLLMFVAMKGIVAIKHGKDFPANEYVDNMIFSALFSIIIGLMVSGSQFLKHLRRSTEDNERLKQEMVQSQFETLKSQVNPHFLFNALNTLTVMIPAQPDIAVQFVEQMAKVFRYSLQHGDDNLVDIATELKVVQSFLFVNDQRYNGKLLADVKLDGVANRKIITQSLLMLVENAIKHNEISTENPLKIFVYAEGDYVVVRNSLQLKRLPEQSTGVGLENIKKRYALTTAVPVLVSSEDNWFTVKIPLL